MAKIAFGHHREAAEPDCIRAVLAEVVLTFLFVFAGVGAAMTAGKVLIPVSSSSSFSLFCSASCIWCSRGLRLITRGSVKMGAGDSIAGLTAVAVAHALVVAVMISAGLHVSGGHLNPAVTLGLAIGGNISVVRSLLYVVAQLLGSTLACLLLRYLTGGLVISPRLKLILKLILLAIEIYTS